MRHTLKRLLPLLLSVLMLLPLLSIPASAEFDHHPYWALQSAYNKAVESGDEDAIVAACEDIIAFYKDFADVTACSRVEAVVLKAAAIYESRGAYQDAYRLYQLYLRCMQKLEQFPDYERDVSERIRYANAFLDAYAFVEPEIYVHAEEPADVPYYGAKNEPVSGTYVGMSGIDGTNFDGTLNNGFLLYVTFEKETIRGFNWRLPVTDDDYMLEVAWNVEDKYNTSGAIEYFHAIADGKHDAYMIEDLKYLNTLENCGVLLRFGAEINNWEINSTYAKNGKLDEFKASFIAAFRHIHDLAETYAPGAAMVYSPMDITNNYVTHADFYPGDDYVDWVGFSSYGNASQAAAYVWGSKDDALYKRGYYTNQLAKIRDIVETYGDRKPIMVSECGYMYASSKTSGQSEALAISRLKYFYSYVNMVFPQVKAIFYFNTNYGGNEYCLFGFGEKTQNDKVAAAYKAALADNLVMAEMLLGNQTGYTRLETLHEQRSDLTMSVYAAYPGSPAMTVTYTLDGKTAATADTVPYTGHISANQLTEGRHTLTVTIKVMETVYTETYIVYVDSKGVMRTEQPDMLDVAQDWSFAYISYCMQEGFFEGLVSTEFYPKTEVSRAMFVTLLGRAAGVDPAAYSAPEFSDVPGDAYYAPYVTWAKEVGVTAGTGDGTTFSPDTELDRAQMCTMIVRYCDNVDIALPEAAEDLFADDADIASWYKDGVYTAKAAGLVSGVGGNRFNPSGKLTREQIAVILKNFHTGFIRGGGV